MTGKIHKEAITISKKKGDNVGSNQVSFTESTSVDGYKAMREKRSQEWLKIWASETKVLTWTETENSAGRAELM